MIWLGTLIGTIARSTDVVTGIAFMTVFPLTFLSNAFVPTESLPDGLRQVAEWNPISCVVAAVRDLFGNPTAIPHDAAWPLEHAVIASIGWCVLILAIVIPMTVRAFNRRTTD
jgi:ABC-2 type transport system permease protein